MIEQFIKTCNKNANKNAFIIKGKPKTYASLLKDIYKMVNLMKAKNIKKGNKVLLFLYPSYEFYVLIFACIYYGVNVVVLDRYNDKNYVKKVMQDNDISFVFCNNVTALLKNKYYKNATCCNVSLYTKFPSTPCDYSLDENLPVLTTFTSGTTGFSKPIIRSVAFLKEQISSISSNIDFSSVNCVYSSLPIYVLFVVFSGRTCVIDRRLNLNYIYKLKVDTVIAPIASVLKTKGTNDLVNQVFLGGARIYKKEGFQIKEKFPSAKITYIYGASECALIALSDLDYYLSNDFSMQRIACDVKINLKEQDCNGVGKIEVTGKGVLSDDCTYLTNDLGSFGKNGLKVCGRSKFSVVGSYNYLLDEKILLDNPKVKRGFSFFYQNAVYFCYEGKLDKREDGITYVKFFRLPMDAKHKTKLDYGKTISILKTKGYIAK